MEILVAKHAGFCFGVKKAIELAEETALKNQDRKTYVFGQLVHNEEVISDLERKGIVFAESIEEIPQNSNVVLRAHGEPGTTYKLLGEKSITANSQLLTDATCPLVTLVHNIAIKLKNSGYEIIIFGKKDHPESIGTRYYIKGEKTFIVENPSGYMSVIDYISKNKFEKAAIISQTTMSVHGYKNLIEQINDNIDDIDKKFVEIPLNMRNLEIKHGFVDTICQPTKQRQYDTEEVAKISEVMIVIGGKNSSNTKELAATCKKFGAETYFIQSSSQLEKEWFVGKNKIGVTAGASTPDSAIKKVIDKIKKIGIGINNEVDGVVHESQDKIFDYN